MRHLRLALAKELDTLNKERQAIVAEIAKEAEEMIVEMYGDTVPLVFVIARRRLEFWCCWNCRFTINRKILPSVHCSCRLIRKQELRKDLQEVSLVLICMQNYRKMQIFFLTYGGHPDGGRNVTCS